MIIPVRCFTCGKVRLGHCRALKCILRTLIEITRYTVLMLMHCVSPGGPETPSFLQVVGNKWETYLELLQLEYSEGCALSPSLGCQNAILRKFWTYATLGPTWKALLAPTVPTEHRHRPQHASSTVISRTFLHRPQIQAPPGHKTGLSLHVGLYPEINGQLCTQLSCYLMPVLCCTVMRWMPWA